MVRRTASCWRIRFFPGEFAVAQRQEDDVPMGQSERGSRVRDGQRASCRERIRSKRTARLILHANDPSERVNPPTPRPVHRSGYVQSASVVSFAMRASSSSIRSPNNSRPSRSARTIGAEKMIGLSVITTSPLLSVRPDPAASHGAPPGPRSRLTRSSIGLSIQHADSGVQAVALDLIRALAHLDGKREKPVSLNVIGSSPQ